MYMPELFCDYTRRLQACMRTARWSQAQRLLAWLAIPIIGVAASLVVHSQTSPPSIPPIALSSDPLYVATSGDKPVMALALSVEFPTVGAQYVKNYGSNVDDILDVAPFVWGRATSDADSTQRSGWYFDFPSAGERQVSNISLVKDTLIFSTLTPDATVTASTCAAGGGTGREYRINVDTGDGASAVSIVGLLGESMAMRIESATTSTKTDSTGRRHRVITTQTFSQGSLGVTTTQTLTTEEIAGRLSWHQIHNYQELKTQ